MSRTLNPDPRLEHHLRRDIAQLIIPRESTVTPVERPLTTSQAWNQQLLSQEPTDNVAEESVPEEVERTLDIHNEQPDHLCCYITSEFSTEDNIWYTLYQWILN